MKMPIGNIATTGYQWEGNMSVFWPHFEHVFNNLTKLPNIPCFLRLTYPSPLPLTKLMLQSTNWRMSKAQASMTSLLKHTWRWITAHVLDFTDNLECCFTTRESPVTVILKSSNLNVHEDGIIQCGMNLWALVDEYCIFNWLNWVVKIRCWARTKNAFHIWAVTNGGIQN